MNAAAIKAISLFDIEVRRVGLISRDYNTRYPNGYRDFSHVMPEVLKLLDEEGCDTALFALYSVVPKWENPRPLTPGDFTHLRLIGLEEFKDGPNGRKAGDYVVYYRATDNCWYEYRFKQAFGRVSWQSQADMVRNFARQELPGRVLGNACFLVCGETNGVKYDKAGSKEIVDVCGLRVAIPERVKVILNPVHDRMSRFEMVEKRKFLSEGGRTLISVWNKGRVDCNGRTKDGLGPAWTVFKDGVPSTADRLQNDLGVDIGIVNIPVPLEEQ